MARCYLVRSEYDSKIVQSVWCAHNALPWEVQGTHLGTSTSVTKLFIFLGIEHKGMPDHEDIYIAYG